MSTRTMPCLVGEQWITPDADRGIDVIDPSDTRVVAGRVPALTPEQVRAVYDAAIDGARRWRAVGRLGRAKVLVAAAADLRARADEVAGDLVAENGKTRAEADVEVVKSCEFLEYYAALARLPYGEMLADGRPGTQTTVRFEPVGVVCLITPWNDPLLTPARKIGPALIAGNAVILKPATETPMVSIQLARSLHSAGLPAGALGIVTGRTAEISEALLGDPRLDALSFTGSTAIGRQLRCRLADGNVRLQTEMGGKNASVVLADADLDLAARTIAAAGFGQTGQRCTATSRVVVDRSVRDEFIDRLTAAGKPLRLGPGADPGTEVGPLVITRHRDEVLGHLRRAEGDGAQVLLGGGAPDGEAFAHGCYVEPTILSATPDMAIWRDEVFGPVLTVVEVDGFDAAIDAANDSVYGLSAAVFTGSLRLAHEFADRVNTGQVSVNLPTSGWDIHMPFGGFGDSGSAFKEQGTEGMRFYSRIKTVAMGYGAS